MTNKERYIICCTDEDIPLFLQYWWMDAVCGKDNWDVLLYEVNSQVVGVLPYYLKKRFGFTYITQPQLTQYNGIWIKYPLSVNPDKKLSIEKEVMSALINQVSNLGISFFQQNFHYNLTNWLPFYWAGFRQTTYYTYRIPDILDAKRVIENFDRSKKKNIKKASKEVIVMFDLTSSEFYENHKMTLQKQGQIISYSYDLFKRLYDEAYNRKQGRVIYCKDECGNIHGALFIVWDADSAYDLISTIDPDFRNSGAASLLVAEAISYLSDKTKMFDFEGSMIENVENSFRKFGSIQTPYFCISKVVVKNKLMNFLIRSKLY